MFFSKFNYSYKIYNLFTCNLLFDENKNSNSQQFCHELEFRFILLIFDYTATLYSLNASLSEVFKSVEGFLCPMIMAQGT